MQSLTSMSSASPCCYQSCHQSAVAMNTYNSEWLAKSVRKVSEGLYTYMKEPGLFYVMEKVNSDNVSHWRRYSDYQIQAACDHKQVRQHNLECFKAQEAGLSFPENRKIEIVRATPDPLSRFKSCMSFFDRDGVDVWSAYVSNSDVNHGFKFEAKEARESIEMAVAVLTHKDAPFQLHMGVHRSPEYMLGQNIAHKRISIDLHSFAAYVLRNISEKRKEFVITTPMKSMADIFKKHLDSNSFQEGANFDGSYIKTRGDTYYDENYEFKLLSSDNSENQIFKVENRDGVNEHYWFFYNTQCVDYFVIKVDSIAKLPNS